MSWTTENNQQLICTMCTEKINTDIFTCLKCSQTFCIQHANEHKQILDHNFIFQRNVSTKTFDTFGTYTGDLRIEDNNQVVIHGPSVAHASVRGLSEYSSGKHRLQFKIDCYNNNKWIFFGIISNGATMKSDTWAIPSSYGWGGHDMVILNCAVNSGLNGYLCDFELNDIVELILDCDHRMIYLKNQRTKWTNKMEINLEKCPFPWHFHLNLYYPKDQVCILSTENFL